ncbi:phage shock protein B [Kordiimonas sediminis]|uniref:Phage shock protein B n=1 Tax=Kordiimonas sediminis TaxID=1735581 RepID=A0A919E5N3_9PROT|nr:envelope stress response membrane protein PspB [Kordiimonas sediminis]GHF16470.1 phage shock protein B [Kordiimonas sediminis]
MEVLMILMLTIVVPLWIIFHYVTKWKQMKGISAEDELSLSDLRRSSDKLEERLRTMERILDSEVPDWRSRTDDL